MAEERKNVTWRVSQHPEHKKINKWLDSQRSIQDSISNIVLHMIDRYGYVNITDYEIQKQLYGKFTDIDYRMEKELAGESEDNGSTEKSEPLPDPAPKNDKQSKDKKEKDDLYSNVDINNL